MSCNVISMLLRVIIGSSFVEHISLTTRNAKARSGRLILDIPEGTGYMQQVS